jgi:hypothetical protein
VTTGYVSEDASQAFQHLAEHVTAMMHMMVQTGKRERVGDDELIQVRAGQLAESRLYLSPRADMPISE